MSRLPLVVIGLAQMLIVANLSVVSISIGPIVANFDTTATNVQSALVVYSLVTAALMIAAAKAGVRYGSLRLFRAGLLVLAIALAGIALSGGPAMLIGAEAIAGAATAALAPAIVALIAANYEGSERTFAIGVITAARGALAMLLAGLLGSAVGWRLPFWILAAIAALVLATSRRLKRPPNDPSVVIDWLGVLTSAAAIVLLTVGVNGIASWGLVTAKDSAPVEVSGLSPSLILIIIGIALGGAFFAHQGHRAAAGRTPLLSPQVKEAGRSHAHVIPPRGRAR